MNLLVKIIGFRKVARALVIGCLSLVSAPGSTVSELSAVHLKAESMMDPLGIDAVRPRLSWRIETSGTNVMQSAYRIVVARTAEGAAHGDGDVWDSDKVVSSKSLAVAYSGPALESGQRCYWSVKVWDNQDRSSGWAEPGCWEMGILTARDWSAARWIAGIGSPAAPLLRTGFDVTKPVRQSPVVYRCGGLLHGFNQRQTRGGCRARPGLYRV